MILFEMRNFIKKFVFTRYKNILSIKMPYKTYQGDAECFYLAGALSVCEDIFKKNRSGELIDRNDVIANLHLIYVDCFNEFQKKYGYKVVDKATLQKPITLSECSDDQEITFC